MSTHKASKRRTLVRGEKIILPTTYEIFEAQHDAGTFVQMGGPYIDIPQVTAAFDELMRHPETQDKKMFIVQVIRRGVVTNFDHREIKPLNMTVN